MTAFVDLSSADLRRHIQGLSLENVSKFLIRAGWSQRESRAPFLTVWERSTDDRSLDSESRLFLPGSRRFADYADRMADVIVRLSTLLGEPVSGVLTDITYSNYLTHQIRLETDTAPGTLRFDQAHRIHDAAYRVFQSAATSVSYGANPPLVHPTNKPRRAQDFLASSVLAPSGIGSYIMTVRTPRSLSLPSQQTGEQTEIAELRQTYGEQVASSLTTAVLAAQDVARSDIGSRQHMSVEVMDYLANHGLSANLCEALSELGGGTKSEPAFDVGLVVDVTATAGQSVRGREIMLERPQLLALREVSRVIKSEAGTRTVDVVGVIQTLERFENGRGPGVVTIEGGIQGDEPTDRRRFRVHLEESDYAAAAKAHTAGQSISVKGTLAPSGTRHHVVAVTAMKIIEKG